MRGTWGVVALLLAITSIACSAKPKHTIQRPDTQEWGLAPLDSAKFNDPPTYPAEEKRAPEQQKAPSTPGGFGNGSGPGSSSSSPFGGANIGGVK